jgi:hypothetical protein
MLHEDIKRLDMFGCSANGAPLFRFALPPDWIATQRLDRAKQPRSSSRQQEHPLRPHLQGNWNFGHGTDSR